MADIKITDLTAYTSPASTDVLPIVDVGADITKKVSIADLMENAGAGSAAAPSIAFDGDNDTGIYLPTANALGISTAGTERLRISAAGLVGIGTSSPQSTLHLTSGSAVGTVTGGIAFGNISNQPQALIEGFRTDGSYRGELLFSTSGSASASMAERMRIDSSGNVGIGVSATAGNRLHVNGKTLVEETGSSADIEVNRTDASTAGAVRLGAGNLANYVISEGSKDFYISTNSSEKMRIDTSGRLLLGTSSIRSNFSLESGGVHDGKGLFETASEPLQLTLLRNNGGLPSYLNLASTGGTSVGSTLSLANGDRLGVIVFSGMSTNGDFSTGATIKSDVDGTVGAGQIPGNLIFSTTAGGGTAPTERMTINSAGVVNFASCPTYADDSAAGTGGLVAGDIYKTSTGELRIKL